MFGADADGVAGVEFSDTANWLTNVFTIHSIYMHFVTCLPHGYASEGIHQLLAPFPLTSQSVRHYHCCCL